MPHPPWYRDGLRFACTQCGRCCTGGPGYTWVTEAEIRALARRAGLSLDAFGRRCLRRVGRRYALLEQPGGDCIFLGADRLCRVYEARPRQCRSYPFWRENLRSARSWSRAAQACEGIRDDAPLLPLAAIAAHRAG